MPHAATWVCGRVENMRREGFELSVSPPRVVFKEEGGRRLEPLEEVICEVDDDQMGSVIEVRPALPHLLLTDSGTAARYSTDSICPHNMHQDRRSWDYISAACRHPIQAICLFLRKDA